MNVVPSWSTRSSLPWICRVKACTTFKPTEVASALYGLAGPPQHIKRLKFSNVIVPPRTVELGLARHENSEVQFTIRSADQQHAQGRLVFPGNEQ